MICQPNPLLDRAANLTRPYIISGQIPAEWPARTALTITYILHSSLINYSFLSLLPGAVARLQQHRTENKCKRKVHFNQRFLLPSRVWSFKFSVYIYFMSKIFIFCFYFFGKLNNLRLSLWYFYLFLHYHVNNNWELMYDNRIACPPCSHVHLPCIAFTFVRSSISTQRFRQKLWAVAPKWKTVYIHLHAAISICVSRRAVRPRVNSD